MPSRDPKLLKPEVYALYLKFDEKMKAEGIDYILTCTVRTQQEQDDLWEIGRSKPGVMVTWTRKSKHITGEAFDIAVKKYGKISWDKDDYIRPAEIGREVGLFPGAFFARHKDYPHFEVMA